jgi:tetratricopeptide (TPR) repeat protein
MKWMFISLAAGGALTYGLVFFVQTQNEEDQAALAQAGGNAVIEETVRVAQPAPESIDATLSPVEVSNSTTESLATPSVTPPKPSFTGDAWTAGLAAYQAHDFPLAVEALEVAVDQKEESPYRHYLLGLSYLKNDEPEGAVEELERSLELSPGNVRALVNLGRAHLAVEDPASAREAIDAALEIDLEDADAWNVLGRIELTQGELDHAEAAFAKVVELDGEHAYGWNNLGYVRIQQGRFEDALAPLQQATSLGVEVSYFYNNLGVVLEQLDRLPEAAASFARANDLGHTLAARSQERIDSILLARGESAPDAPTDQVETVAANQEEF